MTQLSIREQLQLYLNEHPIGKINTAILSKQLEVSRQHICKTLDNLGEIRHHRIPKVLKYCPKCETVISTKATFCRSHARLIEKYKGKHYLCKICGKYRLLEHFAKSKIASSGYETRCLDCRAKWQREYYRTERGRQSHSNATRSLAQKHPERQRAYYQVYKALQSGTLTKEVCFRCNSEDTQAIHSDYNQPFNITWSCLTCRNFVPIAKITYVPNPIEEGFRVFTKTKIEHTNSFGKWMQILKQHYNTQEITSQIFVSSIKEYKYIKGLGKHYKNLASQYAEELLIKLLP